MCWYVESGSFPAVGVNGIDNFRSRRLRGGVDGGGFIVGGKIWSIIVVKGFRGVRGVSRIVIIEGGIIVGVALIITVRHLRYIYPGCSLYIFQFFFIV